MQLIYFDRENTLKAYFKFGRVFTMKFGIKMLGLSIQSIYEMKACEPLSYIQTCHLWFDWKDSYN